MLLESVPTARMRWLSETNWIEMTLARGKSAMRCQESPPSWLRNAPSCAASQMAPRLSTTMELMAPANCGEPSTSQLSPLSAEITSRWWLAVTTIRPSALMLTRLGTAAALCQERPRSVLTSKPAEVAAYHWLDASSNPWEGARKS